MSHVALIVDGAAARLKTALQCAMDQHPAADDCAVLVCDDRAAWPVDWARDLMHTGFDVYAVFVASQYGLVGEPNDVLRAAAVLPFVDGVHLLRGSTLLGTVHKADVGGDGAASVVVTRPDKPPARAPIHSWQALFCARAEQKQKDPTTPCPWGPTAPRTCTRRTAAASSAPPRRT